MVIIVFQYNISCHCSLMSLRVAAPLAVTDEAIFSRHSVSLRVAAPLAVTDEAIFPDNGILILPLLEKIASRSSTTRNDIKPQ